MQDREYQKYRESSAVPGQVGVVALNPDGSSIGGLTDTELRDSPVEVSDPTLEGVVEELTSLVSSLNFLAGVQGIAADLRVTLLSGTLTTLTTVTTVSTVSNQTSIGGFAATNIAMNNADTAYATSVRSNIITG